MIPLRKSGRRCRSSCFLQRDVPTALARIPPTFHLSLHHVVLMFLSRARSVGLQRRLFPRSVCICRLLDLELDADHWCAYETRASLLIFEYDSIRAVVDVVIYSARQDLVHFVSVNAIANGRGVR